MNRSLHTSELEREKDEESGINDQRLLVEDSSDEDSSGVSSLSSDSLCSQTSIPKEIGHESDDSDEDCDNHENVLTEVDLDANPLSTNQDPSSSAIESVSVTSHCSSSTAEDETESGVGSIKKSFFRLASCSLKY